MISLYLDTTNEHLKVYLVKDNKIIFEKDIITKNEHSKYLIPVIEEGLNKNKLKPNNINNIYCAVGPGSFTGSRICITAAKIMAFSLGIKVVPISSLKQYIFNYEGYDYYIPIIKDNKGVYYAIYDKDYNTIEEENYTSKDNLKDKIKTLKGKVCVIFDEEFFDFKVFPKEIDILKLMEFYKDKGICAHALKPNYIKKIEAESKL